MCYYMYLLVQSKSFFANKQTPYFLKKKKTLFKTKKTPVESENFSPQNRGFGTKKPANTKSAGSPIMTHFLITNRNPKDSNPHYYFVTLTHIG